MFELTRQAIPPAVKNKFWGLDENDELVDQQVLAENTKAFFNVDEGLGGSANRPCP